MSLNSNGFGHNSPCLLLNTSGRQTQQWHGTNGLLSLSIAKHGGRRPKRPPKWRKSDRRCWRACFGSKWSSSRSLAPPTRPFPLFVRAPFSQGLRCPSALAPSPFPRTPPTWTRFSPTSALPSPPPPTLPQHPQRLERKTRKRKLKVPRTPLPMSLPGQTTVAARSRTKSQSGTRRKTKRQQRRPNFRKRSPPPLPNRLQPPKRMPRQTTMMFSPQRCWETLISCRPPPLKPRPSRRSIRPGRPPTTMARTATAKRVSKTRPHRRQYYTQDAVRSTGSCVRHARPQTHPLARVALSSAADWSIASILLVHVVHVQISKHGNPLVDMCVCVYACGYCVYHDTVVHRPVQRPATTRGLRSGAVDWCL
eukprot:m.637412 g.637412  ORF g.637412 m.637412 type:complete len:365 (+) comp22600_c1_seq25:1017-2111(+)